MRHAVVVEIAGGSEPLPANAALVRLLAAVDPPEINVILSIPNPLISFLEGTCKIRRTCIFVMDGGLKDTEHKPKPNMNKWLKY